MLVSTVTILLENFAKHQSLVLPPVVTTPSLCSHVENTGTLSKIPRNLNKNETVYTTKLSPEIKFRNPRLENKTLKSVPKP